MNIGLGQNPATKGARDLNRDDSLAHMQLLPAVHVWRAVVAYQGSDLLQLRSELEGFAGGEGEVAGLAGVADSERLAEF